MKQRSLILSARLLALIILTLSVPIGGVAGLSLVNSAEAQERQKGFLELLFQRNREPAPQRQAAPPRPATTQSQPRSINRSSAPVAAAVVADPAQPAVEKSENARTVLVIGDFVADGMAGYLVESFIDVASVVIETRANGSSGLVRDDFYDWPAQMPALMEEVKPDLVVVLLGSNDRQALRINGQSQKPLSEAWVEEYKQRVSNLVDVIAGSNVRTIWVGNPPYSSRSMSADMLALNQIYRDKVETSGGYFVDIWDGFVDANGAFSRNGTDVKGQTVRLRAADGINFTAAGKRKIAFYVERQLKQFLGDAASPLLTSLAPESFPILKLPPLETEAELERTNPIAVADADFDGGRVLLGDINEVGKAVSNPLIAKSARLRLIEDGVPPAPVDGRAGDFRWPNDRLIP